MMQVRAKVSVAAIELYKYPKGAARIKFTGVHDSKTPENNSFTKATPCLELTMTVDNPEAVAVFKKAWDEDSFFYMDFTPVDQ